jgi:pimeloyl-ACP methyl ester carboxylesterase
VVVLHGGPGAPGSARGLAAALSPDFRVLEPLQRRSGDLPLTVQRHVDDLAEVAPERVAVVGWSWGAMLGLPYAALHPERVSTLALVGCGTYDESSRALYRAAVAGCLGPAEAQRVDALERRLGEVRTTTERDEILAEIGAIHTRAESCDPIPLADPVGPLPPDEAGNRETWEDVLRLQREGTEPERFRSIRVPVIMLHGDTDPHPGPSTRDTLRAFVPQLEYVEFERCGHQPWVERRAREAFLGTLRRWLLA